MSQPQQQQNKQPQPEAWKPDRKTIFLLLSDPAFETRARKYVAGKYKAFDAEGKPTQLRAVTSLDPTRLQSFHTLVVLYQDPKRGIRQQDGSYRERFMGTSNRRTGERKDPEPPDVLETQPFHIGDPKHGLWRDNGENDEGVNVNALAKLLGKAIHPCRIQVDTRVIKPGSKDPPVSISVRKL